MNLSKSASSTKEIKRAFVETNNPAIMGCNVVKWGGKYDISTPYGLYCTDLKVLHLLSLKDWIELAEKAIKKDNET